MIQHAILVAEKLDMRGVETRRGVTGRQEAILNCPYFDCVFMSSYALRVCSRESDLEFGYTGAWKDAPDEYDFERLELL